MTKFHLIAMLATASCVVAGATSAAAFDAHSPSDVLSVLNSDGASGALKTDDKGAPYIDAKAGKMTFEVDFYGCNDAKTNCDTVMYAMGFDMTSVTVDQINGWNRWAVVCPAYLSSVNHPRAWFTVKPSPHDDASDVKVQLDAWMSCMSDFDKFTDGPDAFLKSNS